MRTRLCQGDAGLSFPAFHVDAIRNSRGANSRSLMTLFKRTLNLRGRCCESDGLIKRSRKLVKAAIRSSISL